ncbi:hypothetical protein QJQ45_010409 [Haematococcus lacustris]|nr:hypothetical protein QJQ45_010409 [Haematococcus lacustris]
MVLAEAPEVWGKDFSRVHGSETKSTHGAADTSVAPAAAAEELDIFEIGAWNPDKTRVVAHFAHDQGYGDRLQEDTESLIAMVSTSMVNFAESASGSGQQEDEGQGQGEQEVVAERRQVIKAAFRGLVVAARPDLSPAQVDAVVAEVNKRMTMGSKQCCLAAILGLAVLLQSFLGQPTPGFPAASPAPGPPPPPDPACPKKKKKKKTTPVFTGVH